MVSLFFKNSKTHQRIPSTPEKLGKLMSTDSPDSKKVQRRKIAPNLQLSAILQVGRSLITMSQGEKGQSSGIIRALTLENMVFMYE